jgi:hypothetical protein
MDNTGWSFKELEKHGGVLDCWVYAVTADGILSFRVYQEDNIPSSSTRSSMVGRDEAEFSSAKADRFRLITICSGRRQKKLGEPSDGRGILLLNCN